MMSHSVPSHPKGNDSSVRVTKLSPDDHDREDQWVTRATCDRCGEYVEWF